MIDPNDDRTLTERELTGIIKQLVRGIRLHDPKNSYAEHAMDYLVRKNLVRPTDILRS